MCFVLARRCHMMIDLHSLRRRIREDPNQPRPRDLQKCARNGPLESHQPIQDEKYTPATHSLSRYSFYFILIDLFAERKHRGESVSGSTKQSIEASLPDLSFRGREESCEREPSPSVASSSSLECLGSVKGSTITTITRRPNAHRLLTTTTTTTTRATSLATVEVVTEPEATTLASTATALAAAIARSEASQRQHAFKRARSDSSSSLDSASNSSRSSSFLPSSKKRQTHGSKSRHSRRNETQQQQQHQQQQQQQQQLLNSRLSTSHRPSVKLIESTHKTPPAAASNAVVPTTTSQAHSGTRSGLSGSGPQSAKTIRNFTWHEYLESEQAEAAPVHAFKHVPLHQYFETLMSQTVFVEVQNRDPPPAACIDFHTRTRRNHSPSNFYWFASVVKYSGYWAKVRYLGYEHDPSRDFWVHMCSEHVHRVRIYIYIIYISAFF